MKITIVAHITAKPDKINEAQELLRELIEPTRAEEGCITYEMFQNISDPTEFTFVEEWASDAAVESHFETPHLRSVLSRIEGLLASPPNLRKYSKLF